MYPELPEQIGEYQVTGLLGEGAVARVFCGVHAQSGQAVAIKVMREGHNPEYRTVERFIAEVRAVKQIRHRNIIDIYAFGTLPDGRPYFVMEYRPGLTLQQRIDRDGPLTFLEAAPIFTQACSALQAAHDRGIIHRDLKPDNIYLAEEAGGPPVVKLLDFGIAKLTTQDASAALTQVGATVGTPLYMSPEQIRALPLDPRSDIYTLGVTLFQALTGEVPFYANSHAQTATMHLSQPPPRPSEVCDLLPIPERVEQIVLRCLEKVPERRYGSMNELRQALESAAAELMSARQLSGSMRDSRPPLPSIPPLPPSASSTRESGIPTVVGVPALLPSLEGRGRQGPSVVAAGAPEAPPPDGARGSAPRHAAFEPLVPEAPGPSPTHSAQPTQPFTALPRPVAADPAGPTQPVPAAPAPTPQQRPTLEIPAPGTRPRPAAVRRKASITSSQILLWLLILLVVLLAIALGQIYLR